MDRPFKELRFTRSRQAVTFVTAGVVCLALTAAIVLLGLQRLHHAPPLWWALAPLAAAWLCLRLAVHLTRHAFLLLSPIGIEIFPFFRPALHMQLFSWGEIAHASLSPGDRLLTLTLAGCRDAKVIISLDPVKKTARPLLRKAIEGIMAKRMAAANDPETPPEPSGPPQDDEPAPETSGRPE